MIDMMLVLWIVLFVIFFIAGMIEKSYTLGIVSGVLLLLLGLGIIVTGVQIQSGMNMSDTGSGYEITYTYSDATLPFSTYSFVWGIILILVSMYIIYANAEKL